MADIIVNTDKLRTYADQLGKINKRIVTLDWRIKSLYTQVGLFDLISLTKADSLVNFNFRILGSQQYLTTTAGLFEGAENGVLLTLEGNDTYNGIELLLNLLIEQHGSELQALSERIQTPADFLAWIEECYGGLPTWITHGVDVLVPSSYQDAYNITSGLIQGNLTLEDIWNTAKHTVSGNSKLAAIFETIEYTFEKGGARSDEMNRQILEQLKEGDIVGAILDFGEGFTDTIIAGSIEVLADVAGGAVDSFIDNIPVIKGINKASEYLTGLIGLNDGDGYSAGGLIGLLGEGISDGIDKATDLITDATDVVTDAVTEGIKGGIKWVKSWLD